MRNNNRHYYGFYWQYGVGTYWENNDRTSTPAGQVAVFNTPEERAQWVSEEQYSDGNIHRSYVDAKLAVAKMRDVVERDWAERGGHYGESVRGLSTADLIAEYERAVRPAWADAEAA